MRHLRKKKSLNRAADQQLALMRSLSRDLILHGQIETTLSKAKCVRSFVEKLITKAIDSIKETDASKKLHSIRMITKHIQKSDALKALLEKAKAHTERNGGYTRIIKTSFCRGNGAQMALIQIIS